MKKKWALALSIVLISILCLFILLERLESEKQNMIREAKKLGMIFVPAQKIQLPLNAGKQETFRLSGFFIDPYPVTNRQYLNFLKKSTPTVKEDKEKELEKILDDKLDFPVVMVSYSEAEAYARWHGKRLPTEAEWYLAATGGDGREYPWGSQWDEKAVEPCSLGGCVVGKHRLGDSPLGVSDMSGNVFQWTCSSYYLETNVVGPEFGGKMRVIRAGACSFMPQWNKCSFRAAVRETVFAPVIGFRCVKPAGNSDPNADKENNRNKVFTETDFNYSEALRQMISCGIDRAPDSLLVYYVNENLKKRDTVADVASGIGFLTFYLSDITGQKGKVYAVDIDKSVLDFVEIFARKKGMSNVSVILSQPADTRLPENSCDHVFLYAVLTYISPDISEEFLKSIHKGLKKGGKLVVLNDAKLQNTSEFNLELIPKNGFKQIKKTLSEDECSDGGGYMLIVFEKL